MIDTKELVVGDKFFSPIPKYNGPFFDGWKVVECLVVKVNDKSLLISFNAETRKHPDRIKQGIAEAFCYKEVNVWKGLVNFLENKRVMKYPDEKILKQCLRKIKSLEK